MSGETQRFSPFNVSGFIRLQSRPTRQPLVALFRIDVPLDFSLPARLKASRNKKTPLKRTEF